jgi:hypothetical protein
MGVAAQASQKRFDDAIIGNSDSSWLTVSRPIEVVVLNLGDRYE